MVTGEPAPARFVLTGLKCGHKMWSAITRKRGAGWPFTRTWCLTCRDADLRPDPRSRTHHFGDYEVYRIMKTIALFVDDMTA